MGRTLMSEPTEPHDPPAHDPAAHDPAVVARLGGKPVMPKRFYKQAAAAPADAGLFRIELDGRPVRTPGRAHLAVPSLPLAEAVAAEWAAQGETIEPMTMPLTRLVNSAIDGVEANANEVAAEIVRYAGTDLLCYRADGPEKLVTLQRELWDPVLAWAREEFGARFVLSEGVRHVEQPKETLERIALKLPTDSLHLAALNLMTTLSGSAVIALAVWCKHLSALDAWRVAHIDEETQEELWGTDHEAQLRRESRWRDFTAAAQCLTLLHCKPDES